MTSLLFFFLLAIFNVNNWGRVGQNKKTRGTSEVSSIDCGVLIYSAAITQSQIRILNILELAMNWTSQIKWEKSLKLLVTSETHSTFFSSSTPSHIKNQCVEWDILLMDAVGSEATMAKVWPISRPWLLKIMPGWPAIYGMHISKTAVHGAHCTILFNWTIGLRGNSFMQDITIELAAIWCMSITHL